MTRNKFRWRLRTRDSYIEISYHNGRSCWCGEMYTLGKAKLERHTPMVFSKDRFEVIKLLRVEIAKIRVPGFKEAHERIRRIK